MGSVKCYETETSYGLKKYPNQPEIEVCSGCRYFSTKVESLPEFIDKLMEGEKPKIKIRSNLSYNRLLTAIYNAFDLKETDNSLGNYDYPDKLDFFDLLCLKGFSQGYNKAEEEDRVKKKK